MSACESLSFTGITPSVMSCCVNAANQHGANIPNPPPATGEVTVSVPIVGSFTFTWSWDSAAGTATVQCTDSPFLIPCSTINSNITSTVEGCGGSPA